jgi:thermostable 8-oxoguanine DNA glycosylase
MPKKMLCSASVELDIEIKKALKSFKENWKSERAVFEELCFCILTPQSSAKQAMKCITELKEHYLLDKGGVAEKEKYVKNVRFFRTKAKRLVEVQEKFPKERIKNILCENGLPADAILAREFLIASWSLLMSVKSQLSFTRNSVSFISILTFEIPAWEAKFDLN